jgi:hypothetical protein
MEAHAWKHIHSLSIEAFSVSGYIVPCIHRCCVIRWALQCFISPSFLLAFLVISCGIRCSQSTQQETTKTDDDQDDDKDDKGDKNENQHGSFTVEHIVIIIFRCKAHLSLQDFFRLGRKLPFHLQVYKSHHKDTCGTLMWSRMVFKRLVVITVFKWLYACLYYGLFEELLVPERPCLLPTMALCSVTVWPSCVL